MEAKGLNTLSRRFLAAKKHVLPWMSIIQHRTNENPFSRRREWQFVCLKGLEEAHCETCEMKHTCSNKWWIFNWLSRQDIAWQTWLAEIKIAGAAFFFSFKGFSKWVGWNFMWHSWVWSSCYHDRDVACVQRRGQTNCRSFPSENIDLTRAAISEYLWTDKWNDSNYSFPINHRAYL